MERLMKDSPEVQALYDEYSQIWSFSGSSNQNISLDVNKDWEDLNKRINAIESISIELKPAGYSVSKRFVLVAARVAAVLIIAFGLFFLFNNISNDKTPVNISYTATEVIDAPLVLADGSEVFLNTGAEINYPENFTSEVREINFSGNAFFNIAHNPYKPFIISAGELQIEVLGTSFNLCTCPEADESILCLESGKVRFSSINIVDGSVKEQVILTAGEIGIFDKKTGLISKSEIQNRNYLAWKTGVLVFDKTPLDEVISAVEQTYGLKVESGKSLADLKLTARFDNEIPETIFESLQTIFGIQYSIDGKKVFLN